MLYEGMPPPALDEHGRIPWRKEYELLSLLTDMEISYPEGEAHTALGFRYCLFPLSALVASGSISVVSHDTSHLRYGNS